MKQFLFKYKNLLYIIFISFIFITLNSKCSFLFRINDWYDANSFMTIARGILNGLYPYKHLFEQKGPYLYFIYVIGALITNKSFFGVYLLEIIFFSFYLYYISKTIKLFFNKKYCYYLLPIIALGSTATLQFAHGGACEEFCFPLFAFSIYHFIKFLKDGDISNKDIIINGIIAGVILWMKYSLLGFHFIFAATLFFIYLFRKDFKKAFLNCIYFLLGMIIATIPVIIYGIITNSLNELLHVYFVVNLTSYGEKIPLLKKLKNAIELFKSVNKNNKNLSFVVVIPSILFLFDRRIKFNVKFGKIIFIISYIVTGLFIYYSGKPYFYYSLILSPFMIIGLLIGAHILELLKIRSNRILTLATIILFIMLNFKVSPNANLFFKNENDYAQFRFARIINNSDDKTLLNYGFLDGGFYLTADIIPNYYYFMKNNFDYEALPEMFEEQDRYILDDKPKFIVTRNYEPSFIQKGYYLLTTYRQRYEEKKVTYYLYTRTN